MSELKLEEHKHGISLIKDNKTVASFQDEATLCVILFNAIQLEKRCEALQSENSALRSMLERIGWELERIERGWMIMESDEQADIARNALAEYRAWKAGQK